MDYVSAGLKTFIRECRGKTVRIWTDNEGSHGALKAGSAKVADHNRLVHAMWLLAAENDVGMFVDRVSTNENVSDYPSRGSFTVLKAINASRRKPKLPCEVCLVDI